VRLPRAHTSVSGEGLPCGLVGNISIALFALECVPFAECAIDERGRAVHYQCLAETFVRSENGMGPQLKDWVFLTRFLDVSGLCPFGPCPISNSTLSPSFKLLYPSAAIELKRTKHIDPRAR
jgi:hypothetical protein